MATCALVLFSLNANAAGVDIKKADVLGSWTGQLQFNSGYQCTRGGSYTECHEENITITFNSDNSYTCTGDFYPWGNAALGICSNPVDFEVNGNLIKLNFEYDSYGTTYEGHAFLVVGYQNIAKTKMTGTQNVMQHWVQADEVQHFPFSLKKKFFRKKTLEIPSKLRK